MNRNHKRTPNINTCKCRSRAELAARRRQREKKKNSRKLRCLAFLIIFAAALCIFIASAANATKVSDTKTYVVSTGDTLWSIAEYCNTESRDLRRIMDDIMKLNNMNSAKLCIGDKITVPVY
ncbi:MAG: LysM peptidoglycan-binding domain-containing protein [bacterium]|nr:LysM peptidoglycan-binding domain-containing protein [bacterium]